MVLLQKCIMFPLLDEPRTQVNCSKISYLAKTISSGEKWVSIIMWEGLAKGKLLHPSIMSIHFYIER